VLLVLALISALFLPRNKAAAAEPATATSDPGEPPVS
jgi:hypothetical protein